MLLAYLFFSHSHFIWPCTVKFYHVIKGEGMHYKFFNFEGKRYKREKERITQTNFKLSSQNRPLLFLLQLSGQYVQNFFNAFKHLKPTKKCINTLLLQAVTSNSYEVSRRHT
ncbi:hypothetical protein PanWU01x14_281260 [Parasponia andersonii]|uniref:Uncharacterized protein n=1 Tax=Parasponia andersonii TaxID=3476 RepID=A0A2P5B127_PARAD|nr:hypothetical protein PanWU01x14_281260 [Parasponia andersonii]